MSRTQHSVARNLPLCHGVTLNHLAEVLPQSCILDALEQEHCFPTRIKRLDLACTFLLVIAMHLFTRKRLGDVLRDLLHTLRLRWELSGAKPVAGDSAIWNRRQQLGVRPVVTLFRQLAKPLATPTTRGAFLGAYRLAALDGTTFALPNTRENVRAFGGPANQHGPTAWPQLRAVFLIECGTHAVLDAGCWPYATSEYPCARRLLRSLTPDMLVLYDRGLHSYELCRLFQQRGAHFLGRIPVNVRITRLQRLPDGSWLADLPAPARGDQRHQPPLRVRLIEYTLDDPEADGEVYRLITDVLDYATDPADTLACTYHERWEAENTIDELKTHLDVEQRPFRSQRPLGVVQEFYGLLLAHYVVRALMHASAVEGDLDPDRLSFVHAVRVLQRYLPDCQRATAVELPRLAAWIRHELRENLLPPRRDRCNPRAVKQRRTRFPPKKPEARGRYRRPIYEILHLI